MYNLRFERDDGAQFYFDIAHRMNYDLKPLSELDVESATSQGFQQIGVSIENQYLEDVTRDITGHIHGYANDIKQEMLHVFTPFSNGKLYFNERYFCDCAVNSTPAIGSATRDVGFFLSFLCPYPYWMSVDGAVCRVNMWEPTFHFPGPASAIGTNYDSHCFGYKNGNNFANAYNSGDVPARYSVEFSTELEKVSNYGIINVYTMEYIALDDTLYYGETVNIYHDGMRLKVEKTTVDGDVVDIFALLNEGSTLFTLAPGDNVFRAFADNDLMPSAIIRFNPTYPGVYDGM